jgi:hypothetical protein
MNCRLNAAGIGTLTLMSMSAFRLANKTRFFIFYSSCLVMETKSFLISWVFLSVGKFFADKLFLNHFAFWVPALTCLEHWHRVAPAAPEAAAVGARAGSSALC